MLCSVLLKVQTGLNFRIYMYSQRVYIYKLYFHSTLLDSKMSRSFTFTLNSNEPITNISYFPPIELANGEHECALIEFHMYNSIPNVNINNNLFHIGDK